MDFKLVLGIILCIEWCVSCGPTGPIGETGPTGPTSGVGESAVKVISGSNGARLDVTNCISGHDISCSGLVVSIGSSGGIPSLPAFTLNCVNGEASNFIPFMCTSGDAGQAFISCYDINVGFPLSAIVAISFQPC